MDPLKTYDYLTLARQRIFDWARPLSPAEYTRTFSIGLGSLARTLTHIMICEYAYVRRIEGVALPPYDQWPIQDEHPPEFAVIERTWTAQALQTRAALSAVKDWSVELEYRIDGDEGPQIINATKSDIFTQLVLHEVHHRAQAMNILRQLGIASQDIDYNTLMYRRRKVQA